MKSKDSFLKNLIYAMLAQGTSLILSVVMSLIVPKILGVREYSYWQLFLFYITYAGFSHLGINDGLYLRYGGKKREELDVSIFKGQLIILILLQMMVSIVIFIIAIGMVDVNRSIVLGAMGIYMIVFNISGYFGYIFQTINETKIYSVSIIIDRVLFLFFVLSLLFLEFRRFWIFVIFYILSKTISLCYLMRKGNFVFVAKMSSFKESCIETIRNISVGSKLLIANLASLFILGVGRMIIDYRWGVEAFGKMSFSLSLANFFLMFIAQISMVLFPALRRVSMNEQRKLYKSIDEAMIILLPLILLGFFPVKLFCDFWLPAYSDSIRYLALLLPVCIFDSKVQMLYNTYFKVLRKENTLLCVNIAAVVVSFLLCFISAFIFNNILFVVICMVVAVAFRSVISHKILSSYMGEVFTIRSSFDVFIAFGFMIMTWNYTFPIALGAYVALYIIYLWINRKIATEVFAGIIHRKSRAND